MPKKLESLVKGEAGGVPRNGLSHETGIAIGASDKGVLRRPAKIRIPPLVLVGVRLPSCGFDSTEPNLVNRALLFRRSCRFGLVISA